MAQPFADGPRDDESRDSDRSRESRASREGHASVERHASDDNGSDESDESGESRESEGGETAEKRQTLWLLALSPTIWSVHFLASYFTVAIWCAKRGREATLAPARIAIAVYTVVALGGIGLAAWRGYSKHTYGTATLPHDFDTRADRHRFLGFAAVLLSGVSAVGTIYVALAAVFMETCR